MFGCLLSILAMVYYSSGVIWRLSPGKSLGTLSTQPARQSGAPRVRLSISVRQDHSPALRSCRHSDALRGAVPGWVMMMMMLPMMIVMVLLLAGPGGGGGWRWQRLMAAAAAAATGLNTLTVELDK